MTGNEERSKAIHREVRWTLAVKILLSIGAALLAVAAGVALLTFMVVQRHSSMALERQGESIVEMFNFTLEGVLDIGTANGLHFQRIIENGVTIPNVRKIVLVTLDGRVLASSERMEIGRPAASADVREFLRRAEFRTIIRRTESELILVHPIYSGKLVSTIDPSIAAVMQIVLDRREMRGAAYTEAFRLLAISAGSYLVLSIILTLALRILVVNPLHRLADVARRFREGARSLRSHISSQDEIGLLSTAFDDMAQEVETALAQLELSVQQEQEARLTAEAAEHRAAFLAEASVLLSESLDIEQVLARLARLCAGSLAEWCVIDLVEDGAIRRFAWAHADAARAHLLDELRQRFPCDEGSPQPNGLVMRTGEPWLGARLEDGDLRAICESDEHVELMRALGTDSALAVPLIVRGRSIGALSLGTAARGRHFGEVDLAIAQELARRAAIAVDNARLYRESQEAIRLREEFLVVASHELRTPLTPLQLQLESLQLALHQQGLEPLAQQAAKPLRYLGRLTALVRDLLEVARVAKGGLALSREKMDLAEVSHEVAIDHREALQRTGCTLELKAGAPVIGFWDRGRVEQVIVALLSNAMKYGPRRPIMVEVAARDGQATLSVRDFGIGIARQDQQRIFERFERAVPVRSYGGLGLGLYIAREIVIAHGGAIRVESEPGAGAAFIVELPLERRPGSLREPGAGVDVPAS